jgi:hypothetical protein
MGGMRHRGRRVTIACVLCAAVVVCAAVAWRVVDPPDLVARAVSQSVRSAFGGSLAFGSVNALSVSRVSLGDVRYAPTDQGFPLKAEIDQVIVDLRFPILDIVMGRWTPARSVRRVELVRPVVTYANLSEQGGSERFGLDSLMDAMTSNEQLRSLSAVVSVSDGRLVVTGLPSEPGAISFDRVSLEVSVGNGECEFEVAAACDGLGGTSLTADGYLDARTRSYELTGELERIDISTIWNMAHNDSIELSGVAAFRGMLSGTPGDPTLAGVVTADSLDAEVATTAGSSAISIDEFEVSFVAKSADQGSVSARGTAAVDSLQTGAVTVSDVISEFHYANGALDLSGITASIMGGELGGQLTVTLADANVNAVGQGRVRGIMSSRVPVAGIADVIDARLDGTVSLTFAQDDGYRLSGRLSALAPRMLGLTFDDGTLQFTCTNGLVSVDSLVLGLNGIPFVVKGSADATGEASLPQRSTDRDSDLSMHGSSS